MYNAAYIQHVDELTALLYDYEKDKKKLTKKIKCIVKEAYYMSRKGSDAPFVPATPAEWMSLYYQDRATCKRYIKNRDVVYYPEKLSSEFTKYINFIIQILFFYYEPEFNKLDFEVDHKKLNDMLKLVDTNVASTGKITKSTAFSHANIKEVFGDEINFLKMFEKVWNVVTTDREVLKDSNVPRFASNLTATNSRLSATQNFGTSTTFNFLFIKAAVTTDTNTLLLGAYEQYGGNIYSLERVYFWEDKTASNPDDYSILTFDEEINNSAAGGKFYLQDSKKGRRVLNETEVKALEIRYAYYFYVKEDDLATNSKLRLDNAGFKGVTEAANATEVYDKSIAMNKLSKESNAGIVLKKNLRKAANSPMGIRSLANRAFTWFFGWKSPQ